MRKRSVSADQVRAYANKAEQYDEAAAAEFESERYIAATSLAIHAAINAADAMCGARLGQRAAGEDHDQVLTLLKQAGRDGATGEKDLRRLLPLKTRTEYEPDDLAPGVANKAVERAQHCVAVARAVAATPKQSHAPRRPDPATPKQCRPTGKPARRNPYCTPAT